MKQLPIIVTMPAICAALIVVLSVGLSPIAVAQLNCNAGIEFYPNGGIKSCNLNGNHQLYAAQGRKLVCANGYLLVQHPGGKLKSCTISLALTIDSVQCDRLSQVELKPDGTIARCE
ncbi:MAG: hypothetical protein OEU36_03910 [Gammaproteobacteria bacterium]|jgi:hypothetical protein|nr:hypothetical protein [Gammaproteobacteria bacterium]